MDSRPKVVFSAVVGGSGEPCEPRVTFEVRTWTIKLLSWEVELLLAGAEVPLGPFADGTPNDCEVLQDGQVIGRGRIRWDPECATVVVGLDQSAGRSSEDAAS